MEKSKTYLIKIDGVEQAIKDIEMLTDRLKQTNNQLAQSPISQHISSLFSGVSNIAKTFDPLLVDMSANLKEIGETIKNLDDIREKYQKKVEEDKKKEEKEKKEAADKETALIKKISDKHIEKDSIKKKTEIDTLAKQYGSIVKHTSESKKVYDEYFNYLLGLYKADTEEHKVLINEKKKYEEEYKKINEDSNKKLQEVKESQAAISTKDKDGKDNTVETMLKELKSLEGVGDIDNKSIIDLVKLREDVKAEEKILTERKTRIDELAKTMLDKKVGGTFNGYVNIKETIKNYKELNKQREIDIKDAENRKNEIEKLYNQQLESVKKDSGAYIAIEEEKKKKLYEVDSQIIANSQAMKDEAKAVGDSIAENITKKHAELENYYSIATKSLTDLLAYQLVGLEDEKKAVTKVLEEKEKAQKEHQSKIESLKKEAATADGGRAIVLQEQLAREMEAQAALLAQKKDAEKEKEQIEKQIERKKKQQAKIAKVQEIAKATADQAAAIIKAWSMGPVLGPIMAAFTLAATSIQVLKMKREWEKLQDGGLLRGRRHSQGGMRIEGTNIEVEGDEFVVNRVSTRKNMGLIKYINQNRRELSPADIYSYYSRSGANPQPRSMPVSPVQKIYENGGALTNLDIVREGISSTSTEDRVLEAISKINFQPVVSVVDIIDAQESVTNIRQIAGV
ncbi:phage tail tape measure protein [Dysgonomonas sp. 216]|uniref:phage tail tape measure protein n=1 Tax=Dysgonomonas sp. 216 TaxID=2302934 RepID=UPI0013D641D7|nr:phage tail tape measure protein [Dysgonomonas sp. 216]NDW19074.1 phage tail tape measure protein [Dysgonomonas sp. 216]